MKCVVCVTWDDELRTIKIAILSVAFNREQLEAFQRLFEACFLFLKPMKLRSLLKIYLFSLVILYKYYEADSQLIVQIKCHSKHTHVADTVRNEAKKVNYSSHRIVDLAAFSAKLLENSMYLMFLLKFKPICTICTCVRVRVPILTVNNSL